MPYLSRYRNRGFLCLFNHQQSQKTNEKPIRTESKRTEALVSLSMKKIPVYSVEIQDINNEFSFKTEISSERQNN